jgi:hypothetical protein
MTKPQRHVYGPRPVGALVPGVTRATFRERAPATAQVMMDWPAIVGPALAAVTTPRRLSAGTLTIACAGPIAMELRYMAVELINRINGHLGRSAVHSLRFTQVADARLAVPPAPPPAAVAAAEAAVAHLPAGELRDALTALGSLVLARRKPSTRRTTKQ